MPTSREGRVPADMAAALNDPKFLETLERRRIESETLLKEDIEKHYEAFQIKEEVKNGLKEIYQEKYFKELGMQMGDAEINQIDVYLEEQAFTNPDTLRALKKQVEDYKIPQERIQEKEELIAKTREQYEKMGEEKIILEQEKEEKRKKASERILKIETSPDKLLKRLFSGSRDTRIGRTEYKWAREIEKVSKKIKELDTRIKPTKNLIAERDELKTSMEEAKTNLLDKNFEPMKLIKDFVLNKGKEKVGALVKNGQQGVKEAQKVIIDIKKMEGMETVFETLQKDMNSKVEDFVRQEFGKKINEIKISSNSFTRLENALFDILPGTGRDYEEVKNFLVTTLENQLSSLADKKKQYLVNGILLNLKADVYRTKIR